VRGFEGEHNRDVRPDLGSNLLEEVAVEVGGQAEIVVDHLDRFAARLPPDFKLVRHPWLRHGGGIRGELGELAHRRDRSTRSG